FSRFPETPRQLVIELNAAATDYAGLGTFAAEEFAGSWERLRQWPEAVFQKSKRTRTSRRRTYQAGVGAPFRSRSPALLRAFPLAERPGQPSSACPTIGIVPHPSRGPPAQRGDEKKGSFPCPFPVPRRPASWPCSAGNRTPGRSRSWRAAIRG